MTSVTTYHTDETIPQPSKIFRTILRPLLTSGLQSQCATSAIIAMRQAVRGLLPSCREGGCSRKPIYRPANPYALGPGQRAALCPTLGVVGTLHVARQHTYAVGEDPVTIALRAKPPQQEKPICRTFSSALGRTRTCDLLIRSHSPSGTQVDTEGQGETKQRFYQVLALLERQGGTGRDTRLRSDCGQNVEPHRRVLEPEAAEGFEVVCREARPRAASGGILAAISHVRMLACGSLRASGR